MTHAFDHHTNPYAYDLVRLGSAPPGRYSHEERQTLGRIMASKLYHLNLNEPFYVDRFHSSWESDNQLYDHSVEIEVIFEDDTVRDSAFASEMFRHREVPWIIVGVGKRGVVELFNGVLDVRNKERIIDAIENGSASKGADDSANGLSVVPRRDADCAAIYRGERNGGNDGDGGGNGRSGSNGGFDGDPPDGPGGPDGPGDGSGGVGEVMNHPVLFSVERDVFDAILMEI